MARLRVHNFAVSFDGYAAGPDQSVSDPLGVGGTRLHEWVFATPTFRRTHGIDPAGTAGGEIGPDDRFIAASDVGTGATVMGRNMFGPVRGPWPDDSWTGWWGTDPPYHHPVFVLTHYARAPLTMEGGTTFHFVTDGLDTALAQAFAAANGKDVRLGGGVSTVQAALRARLVDELHVAVVPALLGRGERLFDHLDGGPAGYECVEWIGTASVLHARYERTA